MATVAMVHKLPSAVIVLGKLSVINALGSDATKEHLCMHLLYFR